MEIEEQVEKLKMLSNEELRKKFGASKDDASLLKNALRHYATISDNSLTIKEMVDEENVTRGYIYQRRGILRKYGLLKPKIEGSRIGNVKKLFIQKHDGKPTYLCAYFNKQEIKAAKVDPEKPHYYIVEPGDKKFTIIMFDTTQKAEEYKKRQKL